MGIDFIAITQALENRYEIELNSEPIERYPPQIAQQLFAGRSLTANDIYEAVRKALRESGKPIPHSTWNGVRRELAEVLQVSPAEIHRDSRLIQDLGMG